MRRNITTKMVLHVLRIAGVRFTNTILQATRQAIGRRGGKAKAAVKRRDRENMIEHEEKQNRIKKNVVKYIRVVEISEVNTLWA